VELEQLRLLLSRRRSSGLEPWVRAAEASEEEAFRVSAAAEAWASAAVGSEGCLSRLPLPLPLRTREGPLPATTTRRQTPTSSRGRGSPAGGEVMERGAVDEGGGEVEAAAAAATTTAGMEMTLEEVVASAAVAVEEEGLAEGGLAASTIAKGCSSSSREAFSSSISRGRRGTCKGEAEGSFSSSFSSKLLLLHLHLLRCPSTQTSPRLRVSGVRRLPGCSRRKRKKERTEEEERHFVTKKEKINEKLEKEKKTLIIFSLSFSSSSPPSLLFLSLHHRLLGNVHVPQQAKGRAVLQPGLGELRVQLGGVPVFDWEEVEGFF